MRAPISRDSMSRCEDTSMLYDTIRNPMARKVPPNGALDPNTKILDTIETTQQRLNREMMERFQNSSSRVSHQTFSIVVQAGKYLFLALMLPPYLCLYGLPRWFLIDLMPQFFSQLKGQSMRIGKFFHDLSKRIADTMKGILEQTIGDSLRMLSRKSNNLLEYIAGRYNKVAKTIGNMRKSLYHAAAMINNAIHGKVSKIIGNAKRALQSVVENREKALNFAKQALYTILQPLDLIENFLIKPVTQLVVKTAEVALSIINEVQQYASLWVSIAKKIVKQLSSKTVARINDLAVSLSNNMKSGLSNLTYQVLDWAQLSIDSVIKWRKQGADRIFKTVTKASAAVRNKVQSVLSTTAEAASQSIQIMIQIATQFSGWAWWHSVPFLKQQWLRVRDAGTRSWHFFKSIGFAAGTGAKAIVGKMKELVNYSLVRAKWLAIWLKRILLMLVHHLLALPKYAIRSLNWMRIGVVRFARFSTLGARLSIACIWAISRHSLMLMHEVTNELGSFIKGK